jgi:hypothetical protein
MLAICIMTIRIDHSSSPCAVGFEKPEQFAQLGDSESGLLVGWVWANNVSCLHINCSWFFGARPG